MLVSYRTIGHNIRSARREAALTQEQIAERLGMSQLHFGRLERGERPASLEQIAQVAQVLRVPLSSLLRGCVLEEDFASLPDIDAQALADSIAALANGCTEKTRRLMLALCQTVASNEKLPEEE